jgi:hypothetical protein
MTKIPEILPEPTRTHRQLAARSQSATAAGLRAAVFVVAAGIVVTLLVALNLGSDDLAVGREQYRH